MARWAWEELNDRKFNGGRLLCIPFMTSAKTKINVALGTALSVTFADAQQDRHRPDQIGKNKGDAALWGKTKGTQLFSPCVF
jgi:hypothetical protein